MIPVNIPLLHLLGIRFSSRESRPVAIAPPLHRVVLAPKNPPPQVLPIPTVSVVHLLVLVGSLPTRVNPLTSRRTSQNIAASNILLPAPWVGLLERTSLGDLGGTY